MARYSGFAFDYPMSACGDLSGSGAGGGQYLFVMQSSTAKRVMKATGGSNPAPIGVLQNSPRSGEEATVRVLGSTQVYADGDTAIGYGDYVSSGSGGMAVVNAGSSVAGIAMEALTSGTGVLIEVLLVPYGSGNKSDNTP